MKRVVVLLALLIGSPALGASIVVAAHDTHPLAKAKADLVCDGTDDQVELLRSITMAVWGTVIVDGEPNLLGYEVEAFGPHSVEWLPGNYHLGETLHIPNITDTVIEASGAVFHYKRESGDAVRLEGMFRCRVNLGNINTSSKDGVALNVYPDTGGMPCQMSIVTFTGLRGPGRSGYGLKIDAEDGLGVSTCRFEGTDVSGFDVGVYMSAGRGKCDTNWTWLSYVRRCNTCIQVVDNPDEPKVDTNMWYVNVDAVDPDGVAIRTNANQDRWYVIMGTYHVEKMAHAIILDPGAKHNVIDISPPIDRYAWRDDSGNDTNIILTQTHPPHQGAMPPRELGERKK